MSTYIYIYNLTNYFVSIIIFSFIIFENKNVISFIVIFTLIFKLWFSVIIFEIIHIKLHNLNLIFIFLNII